MAMTATAMAQLPPLPPSVSQLKPTTACLDYYANLCGVISERRWEWAAAGGLDGWIHQSTANGVVDLVEHRMRLRRAERWKNAAEDARERMDAR
jgi:hypothetical protein|tara:strand:+ start:32 stop:313 length:282 start_codon:yes stop_codon:yes gene_type:complete